MEKAGSRTRDFHFFSPKNSGMVCTHSKAARDYAKYLEGQPWVASYQAGYELEMQRYQHVNPLNIRKGYFETQWETDFLITTTDGRQIVRELVRLRNLAKQATIEQLEFSRRYWEAANIADWKILIWEVA